MTTRYLPKLLVAGLALLGLTTSPMLMAQNGNSNQFIPFDFVVPCPDEDIYIEGTMRPDVRWLGNSNQHTGFRFFLGIHGRGESLDSGAQYIVNERRFNVTHEFSSPIDHVVFMLNDQGLLIGQGDAPDYFYQMRIQFVVNAKGEVVIDDFDANGSCFPPGSP